MTEHNNHVGFFERVARHVTSWVGSSAAFAIALLVVILWVASGPYFRYSDTWQLVINTGTTIVTFLIVFLIQRSQNNDSHAVHLKLNEIVAALEGASNRLIAVEDLSEEEVGILKSHYKELVKFAKSGESLTQSHSIEEAEARHVNKQQNKEN